MVGGKARVYVVQCPKTVRLVFRERRKKKSHDVRFGIVKLETAAVPFTRVPTFRRQRDPVFTSDAPIFSRAQRRIVTARHTLTEIDGLIELCYYRFSNTDLAELCIRWLLG